MKQAVNQDRIESKIDNYFVVGLAGYALLGGIVTLIGWFAKLPRWTDWASSGISMFPNAAVATVCAGTALLIGLRRRPWSFAVSGGFGVFVAAIGGATLFEHISGIDLGIDTLLVEVPWGVRASLFPGRMGPPASTSFLLLGIALALAGSKWRARRAVPILGMVVSALAMLSLIGYVFQADLLFSTIKTGIALQTSTLILALAFATMASVPDLEPVRTLRQNSAAGLLVRRALPFLLVVPIILGWLRLFGQKAGWYDMGTGLAMLVLALIILLCGLLWRCAAAVAAHENAFRAERKRAAEKLEKAVAERTASLREAVAQMEEFSYTVSHDLRAPLRGMQIYSDALLEDFGKSLPTEAMHYLDRIAANAKRLDNMISDVLTFSRIARAELSLERVALEALVRRIVEQYPGMQSPKVEIEIGPLSDVLGHEPSLTQAFSNLLNNAVKFVPPSITPRVRIWSESHNGHVRVWIEDNGIGIEPKYHHRLFNMFERVHPSLNYEGSGVGLAIVRKATERMGGRVGIESDGTNGSRFWLEIRTAKESANDKT